jgi:hypothetical protein
MEYSGYNFSIPDGSTITAITVRLDAWNNFPECSTKYVLGIHNGSNWSLPPDPEVTPTNVEATYEVGNNLWGLAWTAAAINTNFKVGFYIDAYACATYLDWIPVKVTYDPPATQVPALSEWGVIVFALLTAGTAIAFLRKRRDMTA